MSYFGIKLDRALRRLSLRVSAMPLPFVFFLFNSDKELFFYRINVKEADRSDEDRVGARIGTGWTWSGVLDSDGTR